MKKIIKLLAVLSLVFGFVAISSKGNDNGLFIDTVSAATDGSECGQEGFSAQDMKDSGWACVGIWEGKGYKYDSAKKGFFSSGGAVVTTTTTKAPVVTTTTKAPVVTTTTKKDEVAGTTKKSDVTTKTPETTVTTVKEEVTTAPSVTEEVKTTTTTTTTEAVTTTTKAPAKEKSDINVPLVGGIIVIIAIGGFFIFKKFGNKD